MRHWNRTHRGKTVCNLAFLLLFFLFLLIVFQPSFTPGMAKFRAEYRNDIFLTELTAAITPELDRESWNLPQTQGLLGNTADVRWYFGRVGETYAAIPVRRFQYRPLWESDADLYLLTAKDGLPLVSTLWSREADIPTPAPRYLGYVFGVALDPSIVRVELIYRSILVDNDEIFTTETTEFHDGMFLLYPGLWTESRYILSAYDADGDLVFRDTLWDTGDDTIKETYTRP